MRFTIRAAALALAALAAACTDSGRVAGPTEHQEDPLLAKLRAHGFSTQGVRDLGSAYAVEGDIVIPKAVIGAWPATEPVQPGMPGRPRLQWSTNNVLDPSNPWVITVDLSGLASVPDWQTAARQALTQWSSITGSAIRMVEASPGQITIATGSLPSNVAAQATFPAYGRPGPTIAVNPSFTGSPNNSSTKLRNMVHELGHAIGFRHTNWQGYSCGSFIVEPQNPDGANLIPGTPQTDASSVMNGCTATSSWAGFSSNDLLAARTLYPRAATVVIQNTPLVRVVGGENYWVSVAAYGSTGSYLNKSPQSWSIDNPAIASISAGGTLTGLSAGTTTLHAFVDGVEATATVRVLQVDIAGPSSLGLSQSGTYTATITGPGGPYTAQYWSDTESGPFPGCTATLSCTVTGSQLYNMQLIAFVLKDESTGASWRKVKLVSAQ